MTLKMYVKWVDRVLEIILEALMLFIVIDVTWEVASRYLLKHPSPYTSEIARYLLIWIGLLGASYALRRNMHLGVDVVVRKLSLKNRLWSEILVYIFIILFSLFIFVWGGIRLMSLTLELHQLSAALQIRIGYVYAVIPFTGILMIFYSSMFILDAVWRMRGKDNLVMEKSDEFIVVE